MGVDRALPFGHREPAREVIILDRPDGPPAMPVAHVHPDH
jgi:hypothetical protein